MKVAKNINYDNIKCPKASLKYFISVISGCFPSENFLTVTVCFTSSSVYYRSVIIMSNRNSQCHPVSWYNNWKTALTLKIVKSFAIYDGPTAFKKLCVIHNKSALAQAYSINLTGFHTSRFLPVHCAK